MPPVMVWLLRPPLEEAAVHVRGMDAQWLTGGRMSAAGMTVKSLT